MLKMSFKDVPSHQPQAEPNPDWKDLETKLGWLWPAHVYLFATLFSLLALASFVLLFLARCQQQKPFICIIMLTAVFFMASGRSVMLLVDPYLSSKSTSPWWVFSCVLVSGIASTCLTASLAILLYIITVSTRIGKVKHRVHLGRLVCLVTICNFLYFAMSDLVVTLVPSASVMLTVCQITFSVWGIVVFQGFCVLTWRLRTNAKASFEQARYNENMRHECNKLKRLSLSMAVLSVTGLVFFALRIFEARDGIRAQRYQDSWSWWALQTSMRSLEVINALMLLAVFRKKEQSENSSISQAKTTQVKEATHSKNSMGDESWVENG